MKKKSTLISFLFLIWFPGILLVAQSVQKPEVSVSFDIASGNFLHSEFSNHLPSIKEDGLRILIDGLNQHIGFLNFVPQTSSNTFPYQLHVILDLNSPSGTIVNEIYDLNINMTGIALSHNPINTQVFDFMEVGSFQKDPLKLLSSLKKKWDDYLIESVNKVLVTNIFNQVPFLLPDGEHFHIDAVVKWAILPFNKDVLKIDSQNSLFELKSFFDHLDLEVPDVKKTGLTGIYRDDLQTINPIFQKGGILITFDSDKEGFLKGEVYITRYIRDVEHVPLSDGNDFLNSITED